MNNKLKLFSLMTLVFCFLGLSLNAQNEKKEKEKKVVIIKKSVDKDGNEKVIRIEKEGDEADEMIWINDDGDLIELEEGNFEFFGEDEIMEIDGIESIDVIKLKDGKLSKELEERMIELNVDVKELEDGNKRIRIIQSTDGASHEVIEWDGAGEIPDDIKEKLDKKGIHIEHLDGDKEGNHFFFKSDGHSTSDKAFMGVQMNHTVEVENDNGVETITESGEDGNGVLIGGVVEGSGAEAAGLQEGDVIKKVNGQTTSVFDDLVNILDEKSPGDVVVVEYEREGLSNSVDVTLGQHEVHTFEDMEEEIEIVIDGDEHADEDVFFFKHGDGKHKTISKKKIIIIDKSESEEEEEEMPEINLERSLDLDDFEAFPNPTSGELRVQFTGKSMNTVISISDISGREIYREELEGFDGKYDNTIDLGQAAKGTLLLSINQDDKVFTEKIILK